MRQIAKIIQYGDMYPDLFVFSPFDEEEDWSDNVAIDSYEFINLDGSYLFDDGESKKESKILTKRFVLRSEALFEKYQTQKEKYGRECNSMQGYLTLLKDTFYRGIRNDANGGKLKRLYVQMQDGSIRWTWARPQTADYTRNSLEQNINGISISVDFVAPDPYFYELDDGVNFYYADIDSSYLIFPCLDLPNANHMPIDKSSKLCQQDCNQHGLIIRDETQIGYIGDMDCFYPACTIDPCQAYLGNVFQIDTDQTIEICINGSAGSTSPYISFRGDWDNPQMTNTLNGNYVKYNGSLSGADYIEIDLGSSETGDLIDYTIDTNIPGFDIDDLEINNFGLFGLEIGINEIELEGVDGDAIFTINFKNKYHN